MAIGLDIGANAVRAVQVRTPRRGPPTVTRFGEVALPAGAIDDGEIADTEHVASALRSLWSDFKFRDRAVALGLAGQRVVVRQLDMPALSPADLREALPFQAQDHIPIPVEEALLDYVPVETYTSAQGQDIQRVLLVAAERPAVDTLVRGVAAAKLRPVLVDLRAFALIRSMANPETFATGEAEALVDIGASLTTVAVHQGGIPLMVRMVTTAGHSITRELEAKLGIAADEAEATKLATGLRPEPTLDVTGEAERVLEQQGQRLVMEIRRSLDYFRSQHGESTVVRAGLSGGGSLLTNLPGRLEAALDLPVEHGRPLQDFGVEPGTVGGVPVDTQSLFDAEPYFAVALGLALGTAE